MESAPVPSLPSANLTCVGFSLARNASNICILVLLTLNARKTPRLKPGSEPIVTWVLSLRAAV